jgi:hypothetical protein
MPKSKKQLIIESIQNMDLDMLDMLLDDEKVYQGTTKKIFIEKIEDIFQWFKREGNTFLHSYNGKCSKPDCINKGCSGVFFIGNLKKFHIDLIFKEIDNEIIDVFQCDNFKTNKRIWEFDEQEDIIIFDDEKVSFKSTLDFLIENQKYKHAVEEIEQLSDSIISSAIYSNWLTKYKDLRLSFDESKHNRFYNFNKFNNLYYVFEELLKCLENIDFAKKALIELESFNVDDVDMGIIWVNKYQWLNLATLSFYHRKDFELYDELDYYRVYGLKINKSELKFIEMFKKTYFKLKMKYLWNSSFSPPTP